MYLLQKRVMPRWWNNEVHNYSEAGKDKGWVPPDVWRACSRARAVVVTVAKKMYLFHHRCSLGQWSCSEGPLPSWPYRGQKWILGCLLWPILQLFWLHSFWLLALELKYWKAMCRDTQLVLLYRMLFRLLVMNYETLCGQGQGLCNSGLYFMIYFDFLSFFSKL